MKFNLQKILGRFDTPGVETIKKQFSANEIHTFISCAMIYLLAACQTVSSQVDDCDFVKVGDALDSRALLDIAKSKGYEAISISPSHPSWTIDQKTERERIPWTYSFKKPLKRDGDAKDDQATMRALSIDLSNGHISNKHCVEEFENSGGWFYESRGNSLNK